jgi:hypothetical protein
MTHFSTTAFFDDKNQAFQALLDARKKPGQPFIIFSFVLLNTAFVHGKKRGPTYFLLFYWALGIWDNKKHLCY